MNRETLMAVVVDGGKVLRCKGKSMALLSDTAVQLRIYHGYCLAV